MAEGGGGEGPLWAVIGGGLSLLGKVLHDRRRERKERERKAREGEQYEDAEDRRWREEYRREIDRQSEVIERLRASEQRAWNLYEEMRENARRQYTSGIEQQRRSEELEKQAASLRSELALLYTQLGRKGNGQG